MPQTPSQKITQWLASKPAINLSVICEAVGYDRYNLQKAINGDRDIPDKYINKFVKELSKYGYKSK